MYVPEFNKLDFYVQFEKKKKSVIFVQAKLAVIIYIFYHKSECRMTLDCAVLLYNSIKNGAC